MVRVGTFPLTQERRRRRTISNHRIFQKQAKNALFLALLGSLALFARKPISFFAWLAISNASQFASSLGLRLIGGKPSEPGKPVKLACSLPTSGSTIGGRAIWAENEAGFFIFQKRFEAYLISLTKRYFPSAISSIQIPSSNPSKCCQ